MDKPCACSTRPDTEGTCRHCGSNVENEMTLAELRGIELANEFFNEFDESRCHRDYHMMKIFISDLPRSTPSCVRIFFESMLDGFGYGSGLNECANVRACAKQAAILDITKACREVRAIKSQTQRRAALARLRHMIGSR